MDSSSSISELEFKRGIQAVEQMIKKSKALSRQGVVTIATTAHITLNFTTYKNASKVLRMLKRTGGKTNTQDALGKCLEMFSDKKYGVRKGSFKRVLIVTDGQSNIKKHLTLEKAIKLKHFGVEVFVVAMGDYLDGMDELSDMASSPSAHIYRVKDMDGLVRAVKLIPTKYYWQRRWWFNTFGLASNN